MATETPNQHSNFFQDSWMQGPTMSLIVEADTLKMLYANNMFERYLGYSNQHLQTKDYYFSSLITPNQHGRLQTQIDTVSANRNTYHSYVIYTLQSIEGIEHYFYLFISVLELPGESTKLIFYFHPDVSKWALPFLSYDTRELFYEHFQSENFGTFELLIANQKVYWSNGIYKIYEIEQHLQEIDRAFARSFIHPEDKERVKAITDKGLSEGIDVDTEFRIITAKGNIKIIHSLGRSIKDKEGNIVKFIGSVRDITNQRTVEYNLKRKVEELNRSNIELEEFAYVASHDLQEPLRKITTFGSRLNEKYSNQLTDEGSMYLSRMVAAAENMRMLINSLLDFSRISNNAHPFETIQLDQIVRQVKSELDLRIEETGTQIYADPLPTINAIPSQMKQLFLNIISNAVKFRTPDVKPIIKINTAKASLKEIQELALDTEHEYYKITISDNGIGFENEYSGKIFNVFQRLHGKAEYPGSGIGLAICKKIIERHKGIIYAHSEINKGANFIMLLPSTS